MPEAPELESVKDFLKDNWVVGVSIESALPWAQAQCAALTLRRHYC